MIEYTQRARAFCRLLGTTALVFVVVSCSQGANQGLETETSSGPPRVGPPTGAVIVVGGGVVGPEIVSRFIELAGGPNALIVDVPTAGGDPTYPPGWRGADFLKAGGAKNVVILHTTDRKVADGEQFIEPLTRAGGVWFEGGRQWHLVDSYADTKSEQAFHDVLARGGVVGGSSAGASILSSYMLRGAREGNEVIMAPGYEKAFGFLRGVAIDQHVVARERLRDLADSLVPKHPELLGISEDEGTAWVVRGDVADIIGRNKAFVYGGKDPNDARRPFLTLYPGDRYDLGARRVVHRARDDSPVTTAFIDGLFRGYGGPQISAGMITVLVARDGEVLVDRSYGVPDHPKYMPGTTVPNFPLGAMSDPINALVAQLAIADGKLSPDEQLGSSSVTVGQYLKRPNTAPDGSKLLAALIAKHTGGAYAAYVNTRLFTPIGAHKTTVDADGAFASNVDELYRLELGLENKHAFDRAGKGPDDNRDVSLGWGSDTYLGMTRLTMFGLPNGRRDAFVRFPDKHISIIILTDRDAMNADDIAEQIAQRLFAR